MADRLIRLCALLLPFGMLASAQAQALLPDPTRPPAGVVASMPEAGEVTGPVLQSVLIPKKGRPVAVIGGQQVRLGEKYGESRLIKLSEWEAVLDGPSGIERLLLTPGIEKTNIITRNVTKSPAVQRAQRGSKP